MGACQGALVVYTVGHSRLAQKNLDLYRSKFGFRFNRRSRNLFERMVVAVGCSFLPE